MWIVLSGVFLGWGLGANHTANVFGTGVATGTVKYRTAIVLTAIFVLLGAVLEGPKCMQTVGSLSRLVPIDAFCCTLSVAILMAVLTFFAIPTSASQAIIGAVIGAGLLSGSADFTKLYRIIACWVFTPVVAIVAGYSLYWILRYLFQKFITGFTNLSLFYSAGIIVSGCYGAYCLGSNSVANVTGVYVGSGVLSSETASLIGGLSIASGVLTYSRKVILTIGKGIVPLDPFSALVSVLAGGLALHIFTQLGVPVASSQAIVGGVVGVGLAGDIQTVSVRMLTKIVSGWVVAPISAGLLTILLLKIIPRVFL
ncbi:MAG: inorganic phosphate transporter [Syntrophobacteraceae bacterium]